MSICASSFGHYGVHLGFGKHTAAVLAEYGPEHLYKTAKYQMIGYRKLNIGVESRPELTNSSLQYL